MKFINFRVIFILCSLCLLSDICSGQKYGSNPDSHNINPYNVTETIIWCTVSVTEQRKCKNFAIAIERDKIRFGYTYFKLECTRQSSKDDCMTILDEGKAHLTSLDAGDVFVGGRYHSLIPVMQEIYEGGFKHFYSVAVIKKNTLHDVYSLRDLRGKKMCFPSVGSLAGWVLPIYTLMKEGGMDIIDCNNHVKTATYFFGPSCAVNSLLDKYNPIGDNSDKLCQLCIGKVPGERCTSTDPYAEFQGAFRCLLEAGEVAFLKHTTVDEMTSIDEFIGVSKDNLELLCKDGQRRPVDEYRSCNWGSVPTHALVTSSVATSEKRRLYQKFLERAVELYPHSADIYKYNVTSDRNYNWDDNREQFTTESGRYSGRYKRQYDTNSNNRDGYNRDGYNRDGYNRDGYNRDPSQGGRDGFDSGQLDNNLGQYGKYDPKERPYFSGGNAFLEEDRDKQNDSVLYEKFGLFESVPKYGMHHNLLFQDSAKGFYPLAETEQTYAAYLGGALRYIMGVRECTVNRMTLCVTSDVEYEKCIKMRTALKAQLLKPEMSCFNGHSQVQCMQAIRSGTADVTVFDAGDVYTAGVNFDIVPFMSEVYNLGRPEYYVVAVSKVDDQSTDLTYLKGKYTCHTGINTAAGWVYPMAYLLSNGWIRPYGCNSIRAAAEYFTKSCIPGAISVEYNTGLPYDNMCDLCHGTSFRYCRRDASEDFYGHTGAFRCLVEGGGNVAFVKHTTVVENSGGKRKEWWARDALIGDFQLLCPDGTRAEISEYKRCNLGKVKANAIVTRGGYGYNETEINAYVNLFTYSQQFYGRKDVNEFSFSMFSSPAPYSDLIFQDATQQLKVIEPEQRQYAEYLGQDFMRAQRIVQCNAGASAITVHLFALLISCFLALVFWRE